jgi:16S rRNA (cytidine1402-2'-O)-methyltransferase
MAGRLVVVPTPIGNLGDLTPRGREALATADMIACEDTRRAGRLFELLEIEPKPPLVSNHENNEAERARDIVARIERGAVVALISDAGTPAIADPGYRLIGACIARDVEIEVLPGASAVTTAVVASGLPAHRWRFEGWLPRRAGELERVLRSTETVVGFESPRRIADALKALSALAPDRPAAVCREMTKLHEEISRGTLGELSRKFGSDDDVRGEIVLVIGPGGSSETPDIGFAVDALRGLVRSGAKPRAAASVVAALTGVPANELYRHLTGRDPRR